MANIEHYIPFCIKHESRVTRKKDGETNKDYFERARRHGYVNDTGGHTLTGLTLKTYHLYKPSASVAQLKAVSYEDWLHCMKKFFWDKINADDIKSQSVAEAIIDWFWNSGTYGIKPVQRIVGVTTDGVVGKKTIAAINAQDPHKLWCKIQTARYDYFVGLKKSNPEKYGRYLDGWLNRLNEMYYED